MSESSAAHSQYQRYVLARFLWTHTTIGIFLPVDQIFPATHSHDTSNKGSGVPCRSVTRRPRRRTPHAARVIVSISDCRRPGHHWTSVESGPLPTVIRYHEPTAARHKISMDRAPATQNLPVIVTGTRQVLDASMAADKV